MPSAPSITFPSSGGAGALTLISKQILAAPAASLAFNAIPQTYNHLKLLILARSIAAAQADHMAVTFNGDNGANYDMAEILLFNSAATAFTGAGQNGFQLNVIGSSAAANVPGLQDLTIPNYTGTVFEKNVEIYGGWNDLQQGAFNDAECNSGLWRNTAAINAINIAVVTGPTLLAGSGAWLYGIT